MKIEFYSTGIQFEYYVLNYNFNSKKVEMFNIFNNIYVQEETEKVVRKYLRNPKNFKYQSFLSNNDEIIYGFDGLCKEIDSIIRCEEWGRCEYEISVGSNFITEVKDVVNKLKQEDMKTCNVYDELKKISERNHVLEKWDCYQQCKPNIKMITHEVIRQYKEQRKDRR